MQVKEGKVKSLSPKEAGYAMQLNKYTFLDVRPSTEHNKVCHLISVLYVLMHSPRHSVISNAIGEGWYP